MLLLKSSTVKDDQGFLQLGAGNSIFDGEDYVVTTANMKAYEIPEPFTDAKTATEFIAGLVNLYYLKADASKLSEEAVKSYGKDPENIDEHNPNQLDLFAL